MSTIAVPQPSPVPSRAVVLEDADWKMYSRLLHIFAERPSIRLTYDHGRLEILAPLLMHDGEGRILGQFVWVLTEEMGLTIFPGGSVTMRRRLRQRGIEADECFWIANAPRMKGRRRLDLRTDPPPDLAIEVDVTHSSMDRLGIYATLGVPEVWRLDGDELTFHVLGADGQYAPAKRSRSFPILAPADLMRFLNQARQAGDQNPVIRRFRAWVQKQRKGRG